MVGRLAGDELFVFIPGADISRAEILAKKMVGIPAEDFVGEARYTISAGVVVYENPAGRRLDIDSVRASCSEALIEAKRNGPGSKVVLSR
jgi:GGDEF domain-containing protein